MLAVQRYPSQVLSLWAALALVALPVGQALSQGRSAGSEAATVTEEPTEEQIRTAYAATLEDINTRSAAQLGEADAAPLTVVLETLTKLGCRSLGGQGVQYDCRVERHIRRGDRKPTTDVVQLWLAHEDGRWIAR